MSLAQLSALSLSEVVGDFGFRAFARHGGMANFGQGAAGYIGVIYFLIKCFSSANVIYVNGMWDGMSAVIETLAAYFILGDRLNTRIQWIGLGLLIVGITMVKMGGISK
jgi:multidrug transporter EmrE-like cation transporter